MAPARGTGAVPAAARATRTPRPGGPVAGGGGDHADDDRLPGGRHLQDEWMTRMHGVRRRLDPGIPVQPVQGPHLVRLGQGDDGALGPGAGGAPGPVQVVLVVVRRVVVHDEVDIVDVDAAGGDIGGDEHPGGPGGEGRFADLRILLNQSGLEITRKSETSSLR